MFLIGNFFISLLLLNIKFKVYFQDSKKQANNITF